MKIVFFDFDGVIVDSFSMCYEISNMIRPSTSDEYKSMYEGNIYHALAQREGGRTDIDFFDEYIPRLAKHIPIAGVARDIEELSKDHTLIIVSSTVSKIIEDFLIEHNLRGHFKEILGSDVERSKVKKVRNSLLSHGVEPKNALFVTDTLGDIKEAAECDVKSIAVTWGFHNAEKLKEGDPYMIVDSHDGIGDAVRRYF